MEVSEIVLMERGGRRVKVQGPDRARLLRREFIKPPLAIQDLELRGCQHTTEAYVGSFGSLVADVHVFASVMSVRPGASSASSSAAPWRCSRTSACCTSAVSGFCSYPGRTSRSWGMLAPVPCAPM